MRNEADSMSDTLLDRVGSPVGKDDYVLVAHNGPSLVFGRVWRDGCQGGRITLEIHEAYRRNFDPSSPITMRLQSICSSARIVRVREDQVPAEELRFLRSL